jgi:ribosome biogenesis GTPase
VYSLDILGWSPFFQKQIDRNTEADLVPVRIAEEHRGDFRVLGAGGLWYAELSGRLRHQAEIEGATLPVVGDWALARPPEGGVALIHRTLERRTRFSRRAPGERTVEQIIASNIDTAFVVQSLNRNLNARRLERTLALLWESGAVPVVVLNKADLSDNPEKEAAGIAAAAIGVDVVTTSALSSGGLDPLKPYLRAGDTVALIGSSGVGKSSIVNRLLGRELLAVREIRDDDRGRHATTARHLVVLPEGGLLLDTPGMRTVMMWEGEEGLSRTFEDIEEVAAQCRFRDCSHRTEPGCAIREGLETGAVDRDRYHSYTKLQREIRYEARKADVRLRIAEQQRWRKIHMEARRRPDKREI